MPTNASYSPSRLGWWTVALLTAWTFCGHFNRISMAVAGSERIMPAYQINELQMGRIYSAYLLVYAICMIPGGWLIDRRGPRFALAVMGLGIGVCTIATGAMRVVDDSTLLILGLCAIRGLTGFFTVPLHPGAARCVSLWMPPQSRVFANGLVTTGALVGISSVPLLFGALIDKFDWGWAFAISGLSTLGLSLLWMATTSSDAPFRETQAASHQLPTQTTSAETITTSPALSAGWRSWLHNRGLLLLTISYAAVGYFQYLFFFWLGYYFSSVLKLDKHTSRINTMIPTLAMAGGMLAGGWITDQLCRRIGSYPGRATVAIAGMLGGTLFLALGVLANEPFWIVAWFSCAMASVGLSEGPFWTTAVELGGKRGGLSAAIFNTGGNLGGMLAPVVTPWLSFYIGWDGALPVAGLFCFVGAILWLFIRPENRQANSTIVLEGAS